MSFHRAEKNEKKHTMYEMKEILQKLGMNYKEFSTHYEIPYNTVRQWAQGTRKPPKYIIKLLNEKIERESKGEQLKIQEFQPSCKTCKNSRQISENIIECCIYGIRGLNSFCNSGMYVFQQNKE